MYGDRILLFTTNLAADIPIITAKQTVMMNKLLNSIVICVYIVYRPSSLHLPFTFFVFCACFKFCIAASYYVIDCVCYVV